MSRTNHLYINNLIQERNLISLFPDINIILHIYLSLMCSNCNGGRLFSKLKRIKNSGHQCHSNV